MPLILIKLGGSVLTDKTRPLTPRPEVITQLAEELAAAHQAYPKYQFVLGTGAGSFGHYMVEQTNYLVNPRDPAAIQKVRQSVTELNQLVVQALQDAGLPAVAVHVHDFLSRRAGQLHGPIDSLITLVAAGQIPVVYGDVVTDDVLGSSIASTEVILDYIGRSLQRQPATVSGVYYLTSVDGVLDARGQTLPRLRRATDAALKFDKTTGYDATGGMSHKVTAAFGALDFCQTVVILNGTTKGSLTAALAGKPVGTRLVN